MIALATAFLFLLGAESPAPDTDATALERLAKTGIGSVLSYVLDAPAQVESVRLDLKNQVLELGGLRIDNPEGFEKKAALTADTIRVEADPKSLFSREPLVRLIKVEDAAVNAEVNPLRGINLKKLLDSTTRFRQPRFLKSTPGKRWRIEKGLLEKGVVELNTQLLEKQTTRKSLDRIELSLMGKNGQGVTANEAMAEVLQILMEKCGLMETGGAGALTEPLRDLFGKP